MTRMPRWERLMVNGSGRLIVLALMLVTTAGYLRAATRPEHVPARQKLAGFPMVVGEWSGHRAPEIDAATLQVLGVDDYISRVYSLNGQPMLSMYVGYYESQRRGDTIHSPMNCLPGAGWMPMVSQHITVRTSRGAAIDVNRVLIQKGEEKQIALYWYQGRGHSIASEYWSKAWLVWDAATRNRTDGALVRVISPIRPSDESGAMADQRTQEFVGLIYAPLADYLPN
jgi:EpsI family protein